MKNILLTGATGFVGSYILSELSSNKDITNIYVMLRKYYENTNDNYNYLQKCNERFGVFIKQENIHKIIFFYGDINKPDLGINNDIYAKLCKNIDVIYHVAAEVNHIKSYEQLKQSNVDSVTFFVKLASVGKRKIINYISTLGSAVNKNKDEQFLEEYPDEEDADFNMGYLKSKYMGEKILATAFKNHYINSNIFRLGYVAGDSKLGASIYEDNQLMLFIKSCIQLKAAPKINRLINLTPVDYVAKIISSEKYFNTSGEVIHLFNYKQLISWDEIVQYFICRGYELNIVEFNEWQKMLINAGRNAALFRMILIYRRKDADDIILRLGKNINKYKHTKLKDFCKLNNIEFPDVKDTYLNTIVNYLENREFILKH